MQLLPLDAESLGFLRKSCPFALRAFPASESSQDFVSYSALYPFTLSRINGHDASVCASDFQEPQPLHLGLALLSPLLESFLGEPLGLGEEELDFYLFFSFSLLCIDLPRSSSLSVWPDFLNREVLNTGLSTICCIACLNPSCNFQRVLSMSFFSSWVMLIWKHLAIEVSVFLVLAHLLTEEFISSHTSLACEGRNSTVPIANIFLFRISFWKASYDSSNFSAENHILLSNPVD